MSFEVQAHNAHAKETSKLQVKPRHFKLDQLTPIDSQRKKVPTIRYCPSSPRLNKDWPNAGVTTFPAGAISMGLLDQKMKLLQ